jgi:hypothetical protein
VGRTEAGDKLWRYSALARLWSWALMGASALLFGLSVLLQAGSREGLDLRWLGVAIAATGGTGALFFPLLRVWLRRSALPSLRLPQARRASGARRLEATPADWRRWALITWALLVVGGFAMLTFLIGLLGGGGIAEGVVVGMLAAWGLATLEDARRIERAEAAEGRRYYAACRRPAAVGDRLVWFPEGARGARAPRLDPS